MKFQTWQDEYVNNLVNEGFVDETIGDVNFCGFVASLRFAPEDAEVLGHGYAILFEDSYGFVDVHYFDFHKDWEEEWSRVVQSHAECCLIARR